VTPAARSEHEPVASMPPLLPPSSTPERHPLVRAVPARTGCQPRVRAGGRRDTSRRALGVAGNFSRVAARRPTVSLTAACGSLAASGSFLR